jgi:hypothetical protein
MKENFLKKNQYKKFNGEKEKEARSMDLSLF